MIDFTDIHVQRVEKMTYTFEVAGDTLEELGKAAQKEAHDLYGTYSFRITSMDVAEGRFGPAGRFSVYRATVWTEVV